MLFLLKNSLKEKILKKIDHSFITNQTLQLLQLLQRFLYFLSRCLTALRVSHFLLEMKQYTSPPRGDKKRNKTNISPSGKGGLRGIFFVSKVTKSSFQDIFDILQFGNLIIHLNFVIYEKSINSYLLFHRLSEIY